MFIGHYAVSLALKKHERNASIFLLFLAVQFVDILFFPLVIAGIEHLTIIENYTQSTHFRLDSMPYTHSLVASFLWAGLIYSLFRYVFLKNRDYSKSVSFVLALAVLSHWFIDLIAHTPDLPLLGDSSTKLGLGLWNSAVGTYIVEAAFIITGLWLYLSSTKASSKFGKYGMSSFVLILLLINAFNVFGPPTGDSELTMGISSFVMYFGIAGLAYWIDRKRV